MCLSWSELNLYLERDHSVFELPPVANGVLFWGVEELHWGRGWGIEGGGVNVCAKRLGGQVSRPRAFEKQSTRVFEHFQKKSVKNEIPKISTFLKNHPEKKYFPNILGKYFPHF